MSSFRKTEKKEKPNSHWFYFFLFACIFFLPLIISACGSHGKDAALIAIPAAPTGVTATARDNNNLIAWPGVQGATSYNIYWSVTTAVNKTNGTKITAANNPQAHTGLTNSTPYYYVVTATNAGGESAESVQVAAIPTAVAAGGDPLYQDQWHLRIPGK